MSLAGTVIDHPPEVSNLPRKHIPPPGNNKTCTLPVTHINTYTGACFIIVYILFFVIFQRFMATTIHAIAAPAWLKQ